MQHTPAAVTPGADTAFDLLLRDAVLINGSSVDIAVQDGRIVKVGPALRGSPQKVLELGGRVVLPGLVDLHTHLDKSLTVGLAPNRSGTLLEAVEVMGRLQGDFSRESVRKRAMRTARMLLAAGVTAVRSHVDVTEKINLVAVDAMLDIREELRGLMEIQLVALSSVLAGPQQSRARALIHEALRMGVDVVGGAPGLDSNPQEHIDIVFQLAERFGRPIDLHIDESDNPQDFCLPYLAEKTIASGYQGRVVAGHCCSLAAVSNRVARQTIERVRQAGIAIVTLPSANMYLQGRGDRGIVRRGLTRVREFMAIGVPLCCGSDNIQDPFNPFGKGDLLLVANLLAHAAHLGSPAEQSLALETITSVPAMAMGIDRYGLYPGCSADMVVLDSLDHQTILATVPPRRYVIARGAVVAETRTDSWIQAAASARSG